MAKIKLTGAILDNDTAKIYQWYGFDSICAKQVDRAIKSLQEGEELEIDLNSPGGYCCVGSEIYTMLRQASTQGHQVTVNVVGEACSAATVLMCGADVVKASDVAMFMFHNSSLSASGKARDMRSATECLEQTDESIVNAYELKTGRTREELHDLIDAETWMSAQRAMEYGFVDAMMFEEKEDDPNKCDDLSNAIQNRLQKNMKRIASSSGLIPEDKLEIMKEAMIREMAKNKKVAPVQPKEDVNSKAVNIKNKEGGHKMTLQEAYQTYPELKDEVNETVRIALEESETAQEQEITQAINAERQRIMDIEAISASIPEDMVKDAKFTNPVDAKELAFRALQEDTVKSANYMEQAVQDSKKSGAEDVTVQPDDSNVDETDAFANYINSVRAKK